MKQLKPNTKVTTFERSEEVTDIIDRMPTGWTQLVVGIVSVIMGTALTLGFVIKYPDTVSGSITITSDISPVRIVAPCSGRLHLLFANNTRVQVGSVLGYIECGTSYEDVIKLDKICLSQMRMDLVLSFPDQLQLGSLSVPYNDFVLAYNQFDQLRQTGIYKNMQKALTNQRTSSASLSSGLQQQIVITDEMLESIYRQYKGDSVLFHVGALSDEALAISRNKLLEGQKASLELCQSQKMKQAEMASVDIELAKLEIEAREKLLGAFNTMQAKHNVLCNEVRLWKEHYLITSPMGGILEYLGFWRNSEFVSASVELFAVNPAKNAIVGELTIPSAGAGKVAVGQEVNIRLTNYPYDEFGYVRGRVCKISSMTKNLDGTDEKTRAYLVSVMLPNKVTTNYGKRLQLISELNGYGEIVTKRRRLIERLFDNIQSINK